MFSSIFSPAETCDTLDYDAFALTCNRCDMPAVVRFTKSDSPYIVLRGSYKLRMPYIRLPPSVDMIQSGVPMTYHFPSIQEELLSDNNEDAVHKVLCLVHSSAPDFDPSPDTCRDAVLLVFTITFLTSGSTVEYLRPQSFTSQTRRIELFGTCARFTPILNALCLFQDQQRHPEDQISPVN
jgi:hypothetical protein